MALSRATHAARGASRTPGALRRAHWHAVLCAPAASPCAVPALPGAAAGVARVPGLCMAGGGRQPAQDATVRAAAGGSGSGAAGEDERCTAGEERADALAAVASLAPSAAASATFVDMYSDGMSTLVKLLASPSFKGQGGGCQRSSKPVRRQQRTLLERTERRRRSCAAGAAAARGT